MKALSIRLSQLAVFAMLISPLAGTAQVSQRDQQKAAQRAYEASASQHQEVAREATKALADTANVVTKAVAGAIVGTVGGHPAAGAVAGALQGAMENAKKK